VFYLEDSETRKKESLKTGSRDEAERIRRALNEALETPLFGVTLAKAYLSASDPQLPKRTWSDVRDEFCKHGKPQTKARAKRAVTSSAFNQIRGKKIIETNSEDFRRIFATGKASFVHYLRSFHNLAVGIGWLPWPIVPKVFNEPLENSREPLKKCRIFVPLLSNRLTIPFSALDKPNLTYPLNEGSFEVKLSRRKQAGDARLLVESSTDL
jgi:hypothetical protein